MFPPPPHVVEDTFAAHSATVPRIQGPLMSLRILHVISSVNPEGGGPIEGLTRLAGVHQRLGRTVEVACLDDPDAPWVRDFPIPCHALGPGGFGNYKYCERLLPWLKANHGRFDVVFVNGIWQYHAFAVWRALRNTGTPYFVFLHGMLDPWFKKKYPIKHLKKWLFWPWSEYRILRDAASVLFTCENERLLARRSFPLYQCKEYVVNYGTAAPPPAADRQIDAFTQRFPELKGRRVLIFLGRVHEKKGADLLFHAFARHIESVPERMKGVHLLMVGPNDHPYGRAMAALAAQLGIADHVTWAGMLKGDLKWGALRTSEAFILPSHQENFGIAVAEAMACGLPVLISKQVNIWREIVAAGAGYAESDDVAGTIKLIGRWIDTPGDEWRSMSRLAAQCFTDRFSIERTAESVMHAYELHAASGNKLTFAR